MEPDAKAAVTLTVLEVAGRLRIGRNAAYDAVKRGEIPAKRIGRLYRISTVAFEAWLAESAPTATN